MLTVKVFYTPPISPWSESVDRRRWINLAGWNYKVTESRIWLLLGSRHKCANCSSRCARWYLYTCNVILWHAWKTDILCTTQRWQEGATQIILKFWMAWAWVHILGSKNLARRCPCALRIDGQTSYRPRHRAFAENSPNETMWNLRTRGLRVGQSVSDSGCNVLWCFLEKIRRTCP